VLAPITAAAATIVATHDFRRRMGWSPSLKDMDKLLYILEGGPEVFLARRLGQVSPGWWVESWSRI
jgi:hypothetical protein